MPRRSSWQAAPNDCIDSGCQRVSQGLILADCFGGQQGLEVSKALTLSRAVLDLEIIRGCIHQGRHIIVDFSQASADIPILTVLTCCKTIPRTLGACTHIRKRRVETTMNQTRQGQLHGRSRRGSKRSSPMTGLAACRLAEKVPEGP